MQAFDFCSTRGKLVEASLPLLERYLDTSQPYSAERNRKKVEEDNSPFCPEILCKFLAEEGVRIFGGNKMLEDILFVLGDLNEFLNGYNPSSVEIHPKISRNLRNDSGEVSPDIVVHTPHGILIVEVKTCNKTPKGYSKKIAVKYRLAGRRLAADTKKPFLGVVMVYFIFRRRGRKVLYGFVPASKRPTERVKDPLTSSRWGKFCKNKGGSHPNAQKAGA